jgi:chromosome segregation ATPase
LRIISGLDKEEAKLKNIKNSDMRDFSTFIYFQQEQAAGGQEGIPYWTFWLLLCIILLLVAFIFLRDRSLRQKINSFFFHVKKQLIKRRLRARLKRVNKKRADIIKELGQKAAEEGIQLSNCAKTSNEISDLDEKKEAVQQELKDIDSEISMLNESFEEFTRQHETFMKKHAGRKKDLEERLSISEKIQKQIESDVIDRQSELEKTINKMNSIKHEVQALEKASPSPKKEIKLKVHELKAQVGILEKNKNDIDLKIKGLIEKNEKVEKEINKYLTEIDAENEEMKKHKGEIIKPSRDFQKEILEWEKNKKKTQEKIHKIEMMKEPLYLTLGKKIDSERLERKEFVIFYSKIDRKNKRIRDIEKQIEDLG